MGPQDGVDIVLKLADIVVNKLGRHDTAFTIMGSGDCFNDLVAMRDRLGLQDVVEFTGRVPDETVAAVLSTAAVGISPDPKNSFNDLSTMNKTMEYMAFALPVIAFDLRETRVSAGDAAVYATPNEVDDMARLLIELLDDGRVAARWGRRAALVLSGNWHGPTRPLATSASTTSSSARAQGSRPPHRRAKGRSTVPQQGQARLVLHQVAGYVGLRGGLACGRSRQKMGLGALPGRSRPCRPVIAKALAYPPALRPGRPR